MGVALGHRQIFGKEWDTPAALDTLRRQNKPKGFMCVSCSWAKPADYHAFEFCENGAKATLWELTSRRCIPDFFAKHTVSELRNWNDYDLEQQGRLTHPMRYDAATDNTFPANGMKRSAPSDPNSSRSTRNPSSSIPPAAPASRLLPLRPVRAPVWQQQPAGQLEHVPRNDVSRLKKIIGVGVGTSCTMILSNCDAMFFFGQNTGSNSPRFLHPLQDAAKRGVQIITFNPVREKGLETFVNPQNPIGNADGQGNPDQHPISSSQDRR